ncbi:MAG: WecB/TagA/CpsF family glycosyltransferase [Syntrophomonadaceae bacterium]|jgi:N-acetylglucosaminyldiphosphoundecaprenol N-acetyl-beta-D-mannosaminyltransferase
METRILGCRIDNLDMQQTVDKVESLINSDTAAQIITLNAEILYHAYYDHELRELINRADLVTPDGIGIVWASRKLGQPVKERVTGIDLLQNLCSRAADKGWPIYLLGAAPGVAQTAAENLTQRYPGLKICGIRHGYFGPEDHEQIRADIINSNPALLFAGLGAPKQEYWIRDNLPRLETKVCMGVGGSFDVLSGIKQRAPDWIIKLNLEWLYRLMAEPSRLKRQTVLPRFIWLVLKTKWRNNA